MDEDIEEHTGKIISESLNYSKRMLASTISVIIFVVGAALIISPLYLRGQNYIWTTVFCQEELF